MRRTVFDCLLVATTATTRLAAAGAARGASAIGNRCTVDHPARSDEVLDVRRQARRWHQHLGAIILVGCLGAAAAQPVVCPGLCGIAAACEGDEPDSCTRHPVVTVAGATVDAALRNIVVCSTGTLVDTGMLRPASRCSPPGSAPVSITGWNRGDRRAGQGVVLGTVGPGPVAYGARIHGATVSVDAVGLMGNVRAVNASICVACVRMSAD